MFFARAVVYVPAPTCNSREKHALWKQSSRRHATVEVRQFLVGLFASEDLNLTETQ